MNRESEMARGIVGKYKVQSGIKCSCGLSRRSVCTVYLAIFFDLNKPSSGKKCGHPS